GPFEMVFDGDCHKGIPALAWTLKSNFQHGQYTLFDLADRLRSRGWQVPAYSMPSHREDLVVQRILVRHGMSMDLAELLIGDLKRTLDTLEKN
ncbi:MAG: glutamate decarboxylase, partial [Edwardsiella sp. (in: enterobacteria)]